MPVTALRFDPLIDMQARGIGEAASDISIRGGTYLNTGYSIGGLALTDPQTGHYLGEIPIAPAFLGAPQIRTGAANATAGWNATAGSVARDWQPVTAGGTLSIAAGERRLFAADINAGLLAKEKFLGRTVGLNIAAAHSSGDGAFGDEHRVRADGSIGNSASFSDQQFERYNLRLQLRDATSQTDIFAGYQTKDFAWPNLYAKGSPRPNPIWRDEREDLQTQLYLVNHRQEYYSNGGYHGDFVQVGAYHRINKDVYSIPDINYAAHHRTATTSAALDGRHTLLYFKEATTALRYRAGVVADDLESDGLIYGRYMSRSQFYAGAYADQTLRLAEAGDLVLTAGLTYDESNRMSGAVSPVAGIAWKQTAADAWLRGLALDYSENTQTPDYTALNNSAAGGVFRGNRDLKRSRSRNVGLGADIAAAGFTFLPAVFYRHDKNLTDWIFDPASPGARTVRQVSLDTYGFEFVARRSWERFDISLGYAWLHREDDYTTANTGSYYALNFAEHRLTAALVARLPFGVELRCDNELRFQKDNPLREGTDHPFFTSLSVTWRLPHFDGLSLTAAVDNLWNVRYQEIPLVPGAPRTCSLRATYVW
jgi:hypothetical protein